jgi:hypothetical protein
MRFLTVGALTLLALVGCGSQGISAGEYRGAVVRQSLSTAGLSEDLEKFWRETVFPKQQSVSVIINSQGGKIFGEVGLSPSDPSQYRDKVVFRKLGTNRIISKGVLPGDSGWTRDTSSELRFLRSNRARLMIRETAINDKHGYSMTYAYQGIIQLVSSSGRIKRRKIRCLS